MQICIYHTWEFLAQELLQQYAATMLIEQLTLNSECSLATLLANSNGERTITYYAKLPTKTEPSAPNANESAQLCRDGKCVESVCNS